MDKKIVVITGASDGIGAEAARQLKARGAEVVLVGRSAAKTKALAVELKANYYLADFSKLSDVRQLAKDLLKDYKRIDVLANNAGGIYGQRLLTEDGHEITFQVNHLAPFLLTTMLMELLIKSKATIINTSSIGNKILSKFDINDLDANKNYSSETSYGNAKLANILFTRELDKRYQGKGISAVAFHQGTVATNFANQSDSLPMRLLYRSPLRRLLLISPAKGAETLVWLATSKPGIDWQSGAYYFKKKLSNKVNPIAYDTKIAESLWNQSVEMTS